MTKLVPRRRVSRKRVLAGAAAAAIVTTAATVLLKQRAQIAGLRTNVNSLRRNVNQLQLAQVQCSADMTDLRARMELLVETGKSVEARLENFMRYCGIDVHDIHTALSKPGGQLFINKIRHIVKQVNPEDGLDSSLRKGFGELVAFGCRVPFSFYLATLLPLAAALMYVFVMLHPFFRQTTDTLENMAGSAHDTAHASRFAIRHVLTVFGTTVKSVSDFCVAIINGEGQLPAARPYQRPALAMF